MCAARVSVHHNSCCVSKIRTKRSQRQIILRLLNDSISNAETVVSKWEDDLPYLFVDNDFKGSSSERYFVYFVHELGSSVA
jgi:hypothetical protein